MNERIHRVLDGELSRDQLTPEERSLLADYEATIAAAGHSVPRHVAPDLAASVMARVRAIDATSAKAMTFAEAPAPAKAGAPATATAAARENPLRRALGWLWTPRPIALRPAWALGAAAVAALVLIALPRPSEEPDFGIVAADSATPVSPAEIYVHFRLDAPDANSVHLAGDFTEWQPTYEMHEAQPGIWTVIVPLRAGVHDYAFVIDGETWTPDPLATPVDDGFGGQNSRLSVLPPERIRA